MLPFHSMKSTDIVQDKATPTAILLTDMNMFFNNYILKNKWMQNT